MKAWNKIHHDARNGLLIVHCRGGLCSKGHDTVRKRLYTIGRPSLVLIKSNLSFSNILTWDTRSIEILSGFSGKTHFLFDLSDVRVPFESKELMLDQIQSLIFSNMKLGTSKLYFLVPFTFKPYIKLLLKDFRSYYCMEDELISKEFSYVALVCKKVVPCR